MSAGPIIEERALARIAGPIRGRPRNGRRISLFADQFRVLADGEDSSGGGRS